MNHLKKITRHSTTSVMAIFAEGAVSWTSHMHYKTALSTTEAEIIAAIEGAKEFVSLKRMLSELFDFARKTPVLYIDNKSAIKLRTRGITKCRNTLMCKFFLRERYLNPLKTELNPQCKSQLAELFCGVLKLCASFSKNLNISRT